MREDVKQMIVVMVFGFLVTGHVLIFFCKSVPYLMVTVFIFGMAFGLGAALGTDWALASNKKEQEEE